MLASEPFYDVPEGEDYLAIYETIDRKRQEAKEYKVHTKMHTKDFKLHRKGSRKIIFS